MATTAEVDQRVEPDASAFDEFVGTSAEIAEPSVDIENLFNFTILSRHLLSRPG